MFWADGYCIEACERSGYAAMCVHEQPAVCCVHEIQISSAISSAGQWWEQARREKPYIGTLLSSDEASSERNRDSPSRDADD